MSRWTQIPRQSHCGRRTKGEAAAARKAARRLKTIAGKVVRQLDAGLPAETKDRRWLEKAVRDLNQKREDGDKIYSLGISKATSG
ncbi:MAG: hypothetical protein WCG66_12565 [bacterium]